MLLLRLLWWVPFVGRCCDFPDVVVELLPLLHYTRSPLPVQVILPVPRWTTARLLDMHYTLPTFTTVTTTQFITDTVLPHDTTYLTPTGCCSWFPGCLPAPLHTTHCLTTLVAIAAFTIVPVCLQPIPHTTCRRTRTTDLLRLPTLAYNTFTHTTVTTWIATLPHVPHGTFATRLWRLYNVVTGSTTHLLLPFPFTFTAAITMTPFVVVDFTELFSQLLHLVVLHNDVIYSIVTLTGLLHTRLISPCYLLTLIIPDALYSTPV